MDKFDLLEKVVHTTGVSYEDAKNALEACEWDALEAVIYLEKEGKIEKKGSAYNTETPKEKPRFRNSVNKKDSTQSFLRKVSSLLCQTRLVFTNKAGDDSFSVPLFLALILFIAAFWISLMVLLLFIFIGYKLKIVTPNEEDNAAIRGTLNQTKENISSWISSSLNKAAESIKPSSKPADPCEKTNVHPAEVLNKTPETKTAEEEQETQTGSPAQEESPRAAIFTDTIEKVAEEIKNETGDAEAVFPKDILDEANSEENSDNAEI